MFANVRGIDFFDHFHVISFLSFIWLLGDLSVIIFEFSATLVITVQIQEEPKISNLLWINREKNIEVKKRAEINAFGAAFHSTFQHTNYLFNNELCTNGETNKIRIYAYVKTIIVLFIKPPAK